VLEAYRQHVEERAQLNLPAWTLKTEQTAELIELLKNPPKGEEEKILELFMHRVPPGVDQAAYVKAGFLAEVSAGKVTSPLIDAAKATEILGTMLGGYNITPLIAALDNTEIAPIAVNALSKTLLMFDAYHDVVEKAKKNDFAKQVVDSWATAQWFTSRDKMADKITVTVFKIDVETNTDDLSPASEAWSRPDIPLHAKAMLINSMDKPLEKIEELKKKGHPLAYVGDVVGTGSSRKSAINSVLWYMGNDIPFIPNKRMGGVILGGKIAPIFFNTAEDSGALPIECDVSGMETGDVITIKPYDGVVR